MATPARNMEAAARFVLLGSADCPRLAKAEAIAKHLSANMPSLTYRVGVRPAGQEWDAFVAEQERMFGFVHPSSPVILEEGRLVGGLEEWEALVHARYNYQEGQPVDAYEAMGAESLEQYQEAQGEAHVEREVARLRRMMNEESAHWKRVAFGAPHAFEHALHALPVVRKIGAEAKAAGFMTQHILSRLSEMDALYAALAAAPPAPPPPPPLPNANPPASVPTPPALVQAQAAPTPGATPPADGTPPPAAGAPAVAAAPADEARPVTAGGSDAPATSLRPDSEGKERATTPPDASLTASIDGAPLAAAAAVAGAVPDDAAKKTKGRAKKSKRREEEEAAAREREAQAAYQVALAQVAAQHFEALQKDRQHKVETAARLTVVQREVSSYVSQISKLLHDIVGPLLTTALPVTLPTAAVLKEHSVPDGELFLSRDLERLASLVLAVRSLVAQHLTHPPALPASPAAISFAPPPPLPAPPQPPVPPSAPAAAAAAPAPSGDAAAEGAVAAPDAAAAPPPARTEPAESAGTAPGTTVTLTIYQVGGSATASGPGPAPAAPPKPGEASVPPTAAWQGLADGLRELAQWTGVAVHEWRRLVHELGPSSAKEENKASDADLLVLDEPPPPPPPAPSRKAKAKAAADAAAASMSTTVPAEVEAAMAARVTARLRATRQVVQDLAWLGGASTQSPAVATQMEAWRKEAETLWPIKVP